MLVAHLKVCLKHLYWRVVTRLSTYWVFWTSEKQFHRLRIITTTSCSTTVTRTQDLPKYQSNREAAESDPLTKKARHIDCITITSKCSTACSSSFFKALAKHIWGKAPNLISNRQTECHFHLLDLYCSGFLTHELTGKLLHTSFCT